MIFILKTVYAYCKYLFFDRLYTERMTIELRHLRALVTAAEHATLTDAARDLFISQPTLSRSLQQLERHVGRTLFTRTPHGVELTEDGHTTVSLARDILGRVDMLSHAFTERKPLRLGFAWLLHPTLFADIRRAGEELGCPVTPVRLDDPVSALTAAKNPVDLALYRDTHRPLPDGIRSTVVAEETRCAALPADSEIADRSRNGETLTWNDLATEPLVVNAASGTTHVGSWANAPAGRTVVECSNFEEWIELVATGAGIGAVPELARDRSPHPGIVYADIPDAPPSHIALAWRRGSGAPGGPAEEYTRKLVQALSAMPTL